MKLFEKLLEIQKSVDTFVKDGTNQSDKYDFVTSDQVLSVIRPKMIELHLLLIPAVTGHALHEGLTKSGTTRFMTEMDFLMTWIDCDTGDKFDIPFYAQGVDLAGEKGVGKALTYCEKYMLMKLFHVPTSKDDPDSDGTTKSGEKKVKGTQAAKETADYQRKAITQMLTQLCAGDAEKIKLSIVTFTKNDKAGYPGVYMIEDISAAALPVVYASIGATFKKKTGADFIYKTEDEQ